MKKYIRSYTMYLPGVIFIAFLVILVPLLLEKIFWSWTDDYSINTTKYIFISYIGFFIIFIGILVPIIRKIFRSLKIKKRNFLDIVVTVILYLVSSLPIIIIFRVTLFLVKKFPKHKYYIYHYALSAVLFLRGVKINVSGKIIEIAKVMIANHTSDLDYLLLPWAAGIKPYNIMAGINLKENKKTIEDWIIASTIGVIVENYSISVDREDKKSMIVAFLKMMRLIKDGERGLIFPGGTRLLISEIKEGKVLGDFKEGAFTLAWKTKVPIQPVVFDFPAIYHGKEDHRWGVHTCSIDVYYLDIVIPENYQNVDDFQEACHSMMEEKLKSSKKVQNFLKELQVS